MRTGDLADILNNIQEAKDTFIKCLLSKPD